ncbi:hypothetical protein [Lamprobacter modestohalophilus]|uniref:hypothetical protein n=1 Tax=Lamprobacter modestohalophilus TaxID=1064514 RepID=UPI001904C50A|nr:hypothetical protein [Lamprobacter modestohalophilus]
MNEEERIKLTHQISETVNSLSANFQNFGFPERGQRVNRDALERVFRDRLIDSLNARVTDWQWRSELTFDTTNLINAGFISFDIAGHNEDEVALIELKYVPTIIDGGQHTIPNDRYAFPYDLLKDCIKLELALNHGLVDGVNCTPRDCNEGECKPVLGLAIGLTNHQKFWQPPAQMRNWARNSWELLGNANFPAGPFTCRTDTKRLENAIFRNQRCHLSLSMAWLWSWLDYSEDARLPEHARAFRFILLSPEVNNNGKRLYTHDLDDPAFIPFLKPETREKWQNKHILRAG